MNNVTSETLNFQICCLEPFGGPEELTQIVLNLKTDLSRTLTRLKLCEEYFFKDKSHDYLLKGFLNDFKFVF